MNSGKIRISMNRVSNEKYKLHVSDNGIGLPHDFDVDNSESLGLKLIQVLSQQLSGDFNFSSDHGTHFSLVFLPL